MRLRHRGVAAAALLTLLLAGCSTAEQKGDFAVPDVGDGDGGGSQRSVTLVEQPWIDLQVQNEIAKQLLTRLGYSVKVSNVSVELGAQALSTGDADAYLGNWWPSQTPTYSGLIEAKKVDVLSTLVTGTEYAPAVPGDVARRLNVSSLADLDAHADAFGRKIYGIEAGTPGNETIQKAIDADAYGLGDWKLVESGTPAMLAQVEKLSAAGTPVVFLGWSPHWMTVQFKATFLADPKKVWGGAGEIRTVTRAGFAQAAPDIDRFLANLRFSTDEAGEFYFEHDKRGRALADIAAEWISEHPDQVRKFLNGVRSADGTDAEAVVFS
jgi:glycine betaine/proline transport system substrate-binding protein